MGDKFPMVGSIRAREVRYFEYTTENVPSADGTVLGHSALVNGMFTSRDGSTKGVYASVFVDATTYNTEIAGRSRNSVLEVRCLVTDIEERTSRGGMKYLQATVDEGGPKRVVVTPVECDDDYFGDGGKYPVMLRRDIEAEKAAMPV